MKYESLKGLYILVKKFILFTIFIILLFSLTLGGVLHLKSNEQAIKTISKITKIPGFALSTSYLENRIIYYEDSSNRLYPQMKHYKQMDYVYAQ